MVQTEIAEILNNMREENQRNVENFEKILSGINTKLEVMDEDNEAVELVRFYVAELKKAMEDRFSAVMIKYDTFETSVEGLVSSQAQLAKTSELKDLFGVFSANNDAFMAEIAGQKNSLAALDTKLSKLDEKSYDKEELTALIQDVSLDLSVLGENIQKSFANIEDYVKSLDITEQLEKVNDGMKELRELAKSSPDYSSEFETLENKLENIVSEADFSDFRADLADFVQKIIDNSSALNAEFSFGTERILDAVNSIDYSDLKDDLSVLRGCLDELKEISYQASFDELQGILAKISDNVSTMRASIAADVRENYGAVKSAVEILSTNLQTVKEDLLAASANNQFNPSEILNSINKLFLDVSTLAGDIKENSDNNYNALKTYIEETSANVTSLLDSVNVFNTDTIINGEKLDEISESINKLTPVDYSFDLQRLDTKLDDITNDNTKINTSLEGKFENLKELIQSLDNSEAVKLQFEGFEKAFSQIVTVDDFNRFKSDLAEFIQKIIDNSNALYETANGIKTQTSGSFENICSVLNDLSANVNYLRDISAHKPSEFLDNINSCINDAVEKLNSDANLNFGDLKNSFEKINSEIAAIKEDFIQKNDTNIFNISSGFDNVKMSLENLLAAFHSMGASNESITALDEKISRLNDVVSALSSDLTLKQEEVVQRIDETNDARIAQIKNIGENIDGIKGHINESIECIKNYLAELEVSINSAKSEGDEKVTKKLLDMEAAIVQSATEYEQKTEFLQSKITEFAHIVENSNSDTEGKIASSLEEIEAIKTELASFNDILKSSKLSNDEKFSETVSLIDAGIENIIFNITNISDNVISGIDTSLNKVFSEVCKNFDGLATILNEVKNQNTLNNVDLIQDIENKVTALKEELGLVNSDITSAFECKSEEIIRAFEPVKTGIDEFIGFDFEKMLADIKSQLELAFMNFSVDINSEFAANSQSVSKLEQAFKETFNKISDIEECVNEKIQNNIELLNVSLETATKGLKLNIEGKIEEQAGELRDYFETAFDHTGLEHSISDLKAALVAKLDETVSRLDIIASDTSADELNNRFDEVLEQGDKIFASVDELGGKIENSVNEINENLQTKMEDIGTKLNLILTDTSTDELGDKFAEVNSKLDLMVSDTSTEELHDRFDEVLEHGDKISASVDEFGDKFIEINSKLDLIASDTSAEELQDRFDEVLEQGDKISASAENLSGKVVELSQTEAKVFDMISALHQKVDVLAADGSDFDILEEIDGIKDIIFEQRKFFEVSSDEKAAAIDKYLRDVLLKLDNVDLEKNADDIKEAILNTLVSLFDQISFVEETEEIKDFVEEKTEEINRNLTEVRNQLKQLSSSGDDFDYSYTLQDVEADIAKLRLAVTNMSGNDFTDITDEIKKIVDAVETLETTLTQEQIVDLKGDIEKLNDDIVSISSRTNKLLLTSDEAYKALNDGLNNFGNIIYKLEDRINYLDNTQTSERIERKIDGIHSLAVEADNANKVSRQVMMYLGEWIDAAGENINIITEKASEIDEIKSDIRELKQTVPEKSEILDAVERKFEQMEERIDRLERGLDKALSLLEEKDDTILEKKTDKIEKILSKLGKNIEKLTSYVDEE